MPRRALASMTRTIRRRSRRPSPLFAALAITMAATGVAAQNGSRAPAEVAVDSVFHGLGARPIGPPGTSGRVAAIAVSPRDDREMWVGAATGGLWKSRDAGFTWEPVMDSIAVNSDRKSVV